MTTVTIQLETLTCPSCASKIETAVNRIPGVDKTEILFTLSRVKISYDQAKVEVEDLKKAIEALGFDVLAVKG